MSEGQTPQPAADRIDFDRAEFESAPERTCANWSAALRSEYYECNGQMICGSCASNLNVLLTDRERSSGLPRAFGAGLAAAIAGSAVYAAVRLTGYEFSLIAIGVGYIVGRAVRWGSGGRGGVRFQATAMILTYVAIAASSLPFIVRQVTQDGGSLSVFGGVAMFVISLWLPFAQGWGNILGILIIGIGLWEAWRINREAKIAVTGPYTLKSEGAGAA
jgi:hypothetical protein